MLSTFYKQIIAIVCLLLVTMPVLAKKPILIIENRITDERTEYSLDELIDFKMDTLITPIPWEKGKVNYTGVYLKELLAKHSPNSRYDFIQVHALNDYNVEITKKQVNEQKLFLAYKKQGKRIPVREKGPLVIVYDFNGFDIETMNDLNSNYQLVWFTTKIVIH